MRASIWWRSARGFKNKRLLTMHGRLVSLLLLLVPQLIGWFWLSFQMPHLETPWFSWDKERQLMLLEDQDYRVGRAWFASVLFDLEKETWSVERDRYAARHEIAPRQPALYWRVREHEDRSRLPTAELVNRQTGSVIKQRSLPQLCELVDNRYAVVGENNHMFWLDLDDEQSALQEVGGLANANWVYWHCWSGSIVVLQREVWDSTGTSSSHWIDMVQFADGGPRVIASWPVYTTSNFYHYLDAGDTVVSWDTTGRTLEFRSKIDGKVMATEVMPPGVSAANMQWGLPAKVVHLKSSDGWLNYDLRQRQWLDVPKGTRLVARAEGGNVCRLIDDARTDYFYDIESQTRLSVPPTPPNVSRSWRLHNDETTIAVDQCGLLQFYVYNNRDGNLVKTFAPFRMVPYHLAFFCMVFLIWSALWMRESARLGGRAWFDVFLVIGLPTLFCTWRHLSVGCPWDDRRLTWAYFLGGLWALMLLSSIWFCIGRSRWPLRLIPLLIIVAATTFTIRVIVGDQLDLYWALIAKSHITLSCWLMCLAILRLLGARFIRVTNSGAQAGDLGRPQLSDFFWLTLAGALVAATSGPMPEMSKALSMLWPWSEARELAAVQLIVLMIAFSSWRSVFRLAALLFSVALIAFLVEPFSRMLSSWRIEQDFFRLINYRIVLCAAVATFVAVLPYRMRGYRLVFRGRVSPA